jgi:ABC-type hemin transport system ATPase subunit
MESPALVFAIHPMIKLAPAKTNFARQTIAFMRDFAGFAGLRGVWAATLSVIAAAFEGVSIVLLIPILSIVTASDSNTGPIHRITLEALDLIGAHTRIARLSTLLGLFALVIVVRAVLRRPWLLVLDEATSALDVATGGKILKRIVNLDPRPTIAMIAHRDQSLAYCDRIIRFQSGKFTAGELVPAPQPR